MHPRDIWRFASPAPEAREISMPSTCNVTVNRPCRKNASPQITARFYSPADRGDLETLVLQCRHTSGTVYRVPHPPNKGRRRWGGEREKRRKEVCLRRDDSRNNQNVTAHKSFFYQDTTQLCPLPFRTPLLSETFECVFSQPTVPPRPRLTWLPEAHGMTNSLSRLFLL